jgi:phosphoglycerate dehydrogenase-like enzyme
MQILVSRGTIHGMGFEEYAELLRERLPDCEVTFARTPAEQREALERAEVATARDFGADQLDDAPNLQLFATLFAGTDHLDLDAFERHGVAVTNSSGVHGPNIAEYVVGWLVGIARQFPTVIEQNQRGVWQSYPVRELHGSRAAVVGLGAIGEAVVDRLDAFGVETVGVRYTPEKGGPADEIYGFEEIHEAVADADHVVLACPLSDATRGLIDDDVLTTMRTDATLVNVARGPVVDTDALVSALQSNELRGAVLDVTDPEPLPQDSPLWQMDDVVITPHNAGNTPNYFERSADILVRNVEKLRTGEADLVNRVV